MFLDLDELPHNSDILIRDDVIYLQRYGAVLIAIDTTTDKTIWTYNYRDQEIIPFFSSLDVSHNRVFFSTNFGYLALDIKTGEEVWRQDGIGAMRLEPALMEDNIIYLTTGISPITGSSMIIGIDVETGQQVQEIEF